MAAVYEIIRQKKRQIHRRASEHFSCPGRCRNLYVRESLLNGRKLPPIEEKPQLDEEGLSKRDRWMMKKLTQEERANLVYLWSLRESLPKLTDRFGDLELPLNG